MDKVIEFLSGKKSYIIAIVTVVLGLLQGDQNLVLQGLSVGFLRAGIAKAE